MILRSNPAWVGVTRFGESTPLRLAERFVADNLGLRLALRAMANDPQLRVRYQLAFSLGALRPGTPLRNELLLQLLQRDGRNPWFRLAIQSSLGAGAGHVICLHGDRFEIGDEFRHRPVAVVASGKGEQRDRRRAQPIPSRCRVHDFSLFHTHVDGRVTAWKQGRIPNHSLTGIPKNRYPIGNLRG